MGQIYTKLCNSVEAQVWEIEQGHKCTKQEIIVVDNNEEQNYQTQRYQGFAWVTRNLHKL